MIQAAKFNFKTETMPAKGGMNRKVVIGVVVHVLAAAAYFYVRYLNNMAHHKVMTAASRAVVAAMASTSASSAAAASKTAPLVSAPKPDGQPIAAVAVTQSNSAPARATTVSLGDSLMAVLSPSAKAETMQAPLPPASTLANPAALPVARQVLKARAVKHQPVALTEAQQIAQAAGAKFDDVLSMAVQNPDVFGFDASERVDEAKLGEAIPVYTIPAADQKSYLAGQPLRPLLQATNEWIFPVLLHGSIRYMLPVKRVGQKYVALPGSRALAMVFDKIEQRWPASKGFHPQLVRNPKMTNYYFTIPELPDQNLTDIGDMFQYNASLSPASVILASWQ